MQQGLLYLNPTKGGDEKGHQKGLQQIPGREKPKSRSTLKPSQKALENKKPSANTSTDNSYFTS